MRERRGLGFPTFRRPRTYLKQEPITRIEEQLTSTLVSSFSPTSLISERFWRELRISFKSNTPIRKTCEAKRSLHFRGGKCFKMYLKTGRKNAVICELLGSVLSSSAYRYFRFEVMTQVNSGGGSYLLSPCALFP